MARPTVQKKMFMKQINYMSRESFKCVAKVGLCLFFSHAVISSTFCKMHVATGLHIKCRTLKAKYYIGFVQLIFYRKSRVTQV